MFTDPRLPGLRAQRRTIRRLAGATEGRAPGEPRRMGAGERKLTHDPTARRAADASAAVPPAAQPALPAHPPPPVRAPPRPVSLPPPPSPSLHLKWQPTRASSKFCPLPSASHLPSHGLPYMPVRPRGQRASNRDQLQPYILRLLHPLPVELPPSKAHTLPLLPHRRSRPRAARIPAPRGPGTRPCLGE